MGDASTRLITIDGKLKAKDKGEDERKRDTGSKQLFPLTLSCPNLPGVSRLGGQGWESKHSDLSHSQTFKVFQMWTRLP